MSFEKLDNGRWNVRWREAGSKRNRSRTFDTKRDAQEWDDQKRDEKRRAGLPADASRMTLAELYAKYKAEHIDMLEDTTVEMWRGRWMPTQRSLDRGFQMKPHFLGHKWPNHRLTEITFSAVKQWHAEMKRAGCSDQMMNDAHDALIAVLGYAVTLNIMGHNVAAQIKRPRYQPPVVLDPWLPDRIEAIRFSLLDSAHNGRRDFRWARLRDATFVAVLAYLGLRTWDEGATLRWDQIGERVFVPESKNHKARFVPLPPFLAEELRHWRIASGLRSGLVFPRSPTDQRPINSGTWTREVWAKRIAMVFGGADYKNPYHLRHSCISMWIEAGESTMRVARWAGHRPEETQKTYAHLFDAREERRDRGEVVEDLDVRAEVSRVRSAYAQGFSGKLPAGGGDVLTPGEADGAF